ncbi:uncharacterized protein PpBr36_09769 [Pyricularia pennisetigena]|uniref:uncharacterized protein n=1 Tax=Pyricularia pennisetigena TaxID=1578925 RepID=UPI00114E01CE|nr:uncharacterized protein PpBr36_09769 [Pyricularia pennisetigena]TLS22455.1 hypothetical protein PpBr36_09769 [Pyricularia pennisetigena]
MQKNLCQYPELACQHGFAMLPSDSAAALVSSPTGLRAWVHYMRVSVGREEQLELVHYLTSTAAGKRPSRSISEARRERHQQAVSLEHQGI